MPKQINKIKKNLGFIGSIIYFILILLSAKDNNNFSFFKTSLSRLGVYSQNERAIFYNLGVLFFATFYGIFMIDFSKQCLRISKNSLHLLSAAFFGLALLSLIPYSSATIVGHVHHLIATLSLSFFIISFIEFSSKLFHKNIRFFTFAIILFIVFLTTVLFDLLILERSWGEFGNLEIIGCLSLFIWSFLVCLHYPYPTNFSIIKKRKL